MCSVTGATSTPSATSRVIKLGGERPAGARHLGAAGLERVHVLVRRQGPATGHVAVANRMPVRGQIRLERLSDIEAREPEPDARVRSEDPGEATVRQSQPVTDVNPTERPALGPKLDDPEALRDLDRSPESRDAARAAHRPPVTPEAPPAVVAEVLTTIRSPGARCRGKSKNRPCAIEPSARSVTSSRTPSRSNPRASGGSLASRRTGDSTASALMPRPPPARAHGTSRSADRPRSARADLARSPPAVDRSEMSSPGKASCCICVRMSPGSTV